MLYSTLTAAAKRAALREELASGRLLRFPGAFNPLSAKLIQEKGFEGVYISGAVISADLGLPDIGLTTLSEVAARAGQISRLTDLPTLVDADTGFGEPMNVARTVQQLEDAGVAGLHIEDQVNPKRCGHFDDKAVASTSEMVERILAATEARRDDDLVLIARTDAISTEGLDAAIARAQRYVSAGADVIFVEAPTSVADMRRIGAEVDAPMVINMVEGGKTPPVPLEDLAEMGFRIVLYANAILRMALTGAQRALDELHVSGGTTGIIDEMATWSQRQEAVDLPQWLELDERISDMARREMSTPVPASGRPA